MPNCCFSQECLPQWKHKEAFVQWLPFLHLRLKWMLAMVIEQGLSVLSDGLSVVVKDSPPSQVDSRWWARALCPLRWTLGGGQGLSALSGELSYWILPIFHSPVDKNYSKIFLYFRHFQKFNGSPHHLPVITNVNTELITHVHVFCPLAQ